MHISTEVYRKVLHQGKTADAKTNHTLALIDEFSAEHKEEEFMPAWLVGGITNPEMLYGFLAMWKMCSLIDEQRRKDELESLLRS